MKITWVNHASFILEYENVKLITDPWLDGRAFNESWALLAKTKLDYSAFSDITHIWFSHEHPDHFSPPNINKIPREYRNKITVLFQKTEDAKVIEYCKKIGFKSTIEIDDFEKFSIGQNIQISIGKVQNDTDSWLHIKAPEFSLLNLNDCVFSKRELAHLSKEIGKVDILLTQFSFANWIGNKDDEKLMKSHANSKLDEIKKHVTHFNPKFTIPFASFVWFCHEDNFHFNTYANKIDDIHDYIRGLGTIPLIFYPNDTWTYAKPHESSQSIDNYLTDFSNLPKRVLTKFETITIEELTSKADQFRKKALSKNNKQKLFTYKPMTVHLSDLDEVFSFSYKNGLDKANTSPDEADISFHSQNLLYCFKFEWGFDTILIAGTFQKPKNGNFQNFMEYEWVANLNNQGKRMKGLFGRLFDKIIQMTN